MYRKLRAPGLVTAAAGLTVSLVSSKALEPADLLVYSKGSFSVRPQLNASEVYSDNIYYRHAAVEDDFITTLSPGFFARLGYPDQNYFEVGYAFDQVLYAQHSQENAEQHRFNIGEHFKTSRLAWDGSDRIEFLSSVIGAGNVIGVGGSAGVPANVIVSVRGQKVDRELNAHSHTFTYEISPRTSVYFTGAYTALDYEKDVILYDYNELLGTFGFGYKAFSKITFFGEMYYGQSATDPNFVLQLKAPHSDVKGGFVGARGIFTEKLTGTVKAGYETRDYSDDRNGTAAPVVEASLNFKPLDRTQLTLAYSRRTLTSLEYGNQSFTYDSVSLAGAQRLGSEERYKVSLGGSFYNYAYSQGAGGREDQYYSVFGNVSYDWKKWLTTTLGYDFVALKSSIPGVDYDVNRVTLSMALGY